MNRTDYLKALAAVEELLEPPLPVPGDFLTLGAATAEGPLGLAAAFTLSWAFDRLGNLPSAQLGEGWLLFLPSEVRQRCGLTKDQQAAAIQTLNGRGLMETEKRPNGFYCRINIEALRNALTLEKSVALDSADDEEEEA